MIDSFELEVTARCNLDCRHCAIALPEADKAAKKRELGVGEIDRIAAEAAALGAGRCLITGGEPFLRKDFRELYQAVLSKGLRVSLATNATLVTDDDVRFLRKFPPQDIEVTVFGLTRETYERVTRRSGSFAAFKSGLDRLLAGGITVRL
ncbi:MAG: Radical domain protein, partial [Candidatus Aminicenantes bacterium]|nr:Radical domain protein [Candidatus Aminicenantes bacterium]